LDFSLEVFKNLIKILKFGPFEILFWFYEHLKT